MNFAISLYSSCKRLITRTVVGFMVLIEKEWSGFAYPFITKRKSAEPNDYVMKVC